MEIIGHIHKRQKLTHPTGQDYLPVNLPDVIVIPIRLEER